MALSNWRAAMIEKDRIVYTSDPRIIADIEDNNFHSPIPVRSTGTGYWVQHWSMEQYRENRMALAAVETQS